MSEGNETTNADRVRIKRNELDIQKIWGEINRMKTWVIIAMAAVLLQVGMTAMKLIARVLP